MNSELTPADAEKLVVLLRATVQSNGASAIIIVPHGANDAAYSYVNMGIGTSVDILTGVRRALVGKMAEA